MLFRSWPAGRIAAFYPATRARAAEVQRQAESEGVRLIGEPASLAHADIVLSAVRPDTALEAAGTVIPHLPPGTVYADINSTSAALKQRIAAMATERGIRFADVALYGAAPIFRHRARMHASGDGAEPFRDALAPYGGNVRVLQGGPGAAAQFKMLRSVVLKGVAMLLAESMVAARQAGMEAELLDELGATFESLPFRRQAERWLTGSAEHAGRRVGEMDFVLETLRGLGIRPWMTAATRESLRRIAAAGAGKAQTWQEALDTLAPAWLTEQHPDLRTEDRDGTPEMRRTDRAEELER